MLSAKQRDSNLLAYDDIVPPFTQRSISMGKSSTSRKSSDTENSLPIPMHTRAASTPAHMEAPARDEAITVHAHHKRFPSCVETSPRKEAKKFSADHYLVRNADDRHSKRAMSETKEKLTKRNASSPGAMSLLNNMEKYRFDERGGKAPMKHNQSLPLKATPELLAELLRGSSEKMTTAEQRERNKKLLHVDAYALPMAVQQFLVSAFVSLIYYFHNIWNSISMRHLHSAVYSDMANGFSKKKCVQSARTRKHRSQAKPSEIEYSMFVNQYKQIWPTLRFCNKQKKKMKQNEPTFAIWEFCTHFFRSLFIRFFWIARTFIALWCLKSYSRFEIIKLQRIIDRENSIIYTMQLFSNIYRLSLPHAFAAVCATRLGATLFLFCILPDESSNGSLFRGQFYVSDENVSRKKKRT